jgi:hypothetical protein
VGQCDGASPEDLWASYIGRRHLAHLIEDSGGRGLSNAANHSDRSVRRRRAIGYFDTHRDGSDAGVLGSIRYR